MGVGNDPRYNKTRCFETFPFPDCTDAQAVLVRDLAEQIDGHRKRQQGQFSDLTLTGLYNVLEKLRHGESLSTKEREIHELGLVSVLRELHDRLDAAVFDAYGWSDLAPILVGRPGATTPLPDKPAEQEEAEEELLGRLVELNRQRAAEEARGLVRWLRPEYQAQEGRAPLQGELDTEETRIEKAASRGTDKGRAAKQPWPKNAAEQAKAVADIIAGSAAGLTIDEIASHFSARGRWRERLLPLADMLVLLGKARTIPGGDTPRFAAS